MRRLVCLLLCLMLCMTAATAMALPALVPQAATWNPGEKPVRVTLTASLAAHMPFDDVRCAQLDALIGHLSMTLVTQSLQGESRGSVAIAVDGCDTLTMVQRETAADTQLQFSFLPDATYAVPIGSGSATGLLLGAEDAAASLYGLNGTETIWLEHAYAMLTGARDALSDVAREADIRTSISGMGTARLKVTCTVPKDDAPRMKDALLSACPEGPLHGLVSGMTFSGTQKLFFWLDAEGNILRIEFAGNVGPDAESLRKVSLVWRMKRTDTVRKDDLVLKTPSVKGNSRNNVVYKAETTVSEDAQVTASSEWKYEVVQSGRKSVLTGETDLISRQQDGATALSGSVTLSRKLPEDDNAVAWTFTPELLLDEDGGVPVVKGSLRVQQTMGKGTLEDITIGIDAGPGEDVPWELRPDAVTVQGADDAALSAHRQRIEVAMSTALIRPLVLLPAEDTLFLSADLPEDVWQAIVQAARQATAEEDVP